MNLGCLGLVSASGFYLMAGLGSVSLAYFTVWSILKVELALLLL